MTLYGELSRFLNSGLWKDALRPKLQEWADGKAAAMASARTPEDLWDARTAANTAKEGLDLLDSALDGLRTKLMEAGRPPVQAA